jgi:hypothetical protein
MVSGWSGAIVSQLRRAALHEEIWGLGDQFRSFQTCESLLYSAAQFAVTKPRVFVLEKLVQVCLLGR